MKFEEIEIKYNSVVVCIPNGKRKEREFQTDEKLRVKIPCIDLEPVAIFKTKEYSETEIKIFYHNNEFYVQDIKHSCFMKSIENGTYDFFNYPNADNSFFYKSGYRRHKYARFDKFSNEDCKIIFDSKQEDEEIIKNHMNNFYMINGVISQKCSEPVLVKHKSLDDNVELVVEKQEEKNKMKFRHIINWNDIQEILDKKFKKAKECSEYFAKLEKPDTYDYRDLYENTKIHNEGTKMFKNVFSDWKKHNLLIFSLKIFSELKKNGKLFDYDIDDFEKIIALKNFLKNTFGEKKINNFDLENFEYMKMADVNYHFDEGMAVLENLCNLKNKNNISYEIKDVSDFIEKIKKQNLLHQNETIKI